MIETFSIFRPFADTLHHGMTLRGWNGLYGTPEKPVMAKQVHGDEVLIINDSTNKEPRSGDALITRTPGVAVAVCVADCQGILMFDPATKTVAAVHCGWRGSAKNIIGKTVAALAQLGAEPKNLRVGISPSLGPCCAEFTDPKNELPPPCHAYIRENRVDFWALSQAQCESAGIPSSQIGIARKCTKCDPEKYWSHRGGHRERMNIFIGLKP